MSREEFIEKATAAAREARDKGAPISVPIAVAQAALESGFGRSQLAREANNLGGVKAGSSWTGPILELPTREYRAEDGTWYSTVARWRRYPDWASYFSDYGDLIQRVYPQSAAAKGDPRAFLEGLVSDRLKYATDPRYVEKVWAIVEQYDLLNSEPAGLLIIYGTSNEELARFPMSQGAQVVTRAAGDRYYVRLEAPEGR